MNNSYIDWVALAVILVLLGWTARRFSRRTYRLAALAAVLASVVGLAKHGEAFVDHSPKHTYDFVDSFYAGSKNVIQAMVNPIVTVDGHALPLTIAWGTLLALCVAALLVFDAWSARRELPRVQIPPPDPEAGDPGLADRRAVTEELRFRLPAVRVRKPATMPGGEKLDDLATLVEASEVKGGKLTAALMRVVHILEAHPRTYEVRCLVERCTPDGRLSSNGSSMRVTVDMQDARTGQTIAVHTLPPCNCQDAAEQVAGFAARQVFRDDPSTPAWAVGSKNGQDLAAYLLSQEMCATGPTFEELRQSRRRREEKLEEAVKTDPAAGVIGYELAAMYDLDGDYLKSLLVHLRNRASYPRFWAGRYRLAISLSTLAWLIADKGLDSVRDEIKRQFDEAADREEIARRLASAPLLRSKALLPRIGKAQSKILRDNIRKILLGDIPRDKATLTDASRALLSLAVLELRSYRRAAGTFRVLWNAFWHRELRASLLQTLRGDWRWLHPARRRLTAAIAIKIARERRKLLGGQSGSLGKTQEWARRRLGVEPGCDQPADLAKTVPWPAAYNAACLFALARPGDPPPREEDEKDEKDEKGKEAIRLLRLATGHPDCDLEHTSESIAKDPGLHALHDQDAFQEFVRDLLERDFAPGAPAQLNDAWLLERLREISAEDTRPEPWAWLWTSWLRSALPAYRGGSSTAT
jgi:hypothetical protein